MNTPVFVQQVRFWIQPCFSDLLSVVASGCEKWDDTPSSKNECCKWDEIGTLNPLKIYSKLLLPKKSRAAAVCVSISIEAKNPNNWFRYMQTPLHSPTKMNFVFPIGLEVYGFSDFFPFWKLEKTQNHWGVHRLHQLNMRTWKGCKNARNTQNSAFLVFFFLKKFTGSTRSKGFWMWIDEWKYESSLVKKHSENRKCHNMESKINK